jgi:hypothetical protein
MYSCFLVIVYSKFRRQNRILLRINFTFYFIAVNVWLGECFDFVFSYFYSYEHNS